MKNTLHRIVLLVGLLALVQPASGTILEEFEKFFANNPTNHWDLSGYGLYVNSGRIAEGVKPFGYGGGARVGYWLTPSVGAALDVNYAASTWTFMSLGLAARVSVNCGEFATLTPYGTAGPAWNLRGPEQSIVAVAGAGATLDLKKLKLFQFFGEYQYVTTTDPQERILFGLVKRF